MSLMPVQIIHPWSAAAAALVAVVVAWALLRAGGTDRSGARISRSLRWRMVCLLLPGIAAVAALLAGSDVTLERGGRSADRVVLLLDISASARASPWRDPQWVRRLALSRLAGAAQNHLTVIGFARQPRILLENVSAGDPARWPSAWTAFGQDDGTNLPAALAWRAPGETAPTAAPRWLITDGLVPWPQQLLPAAATVSTPRGDVGITNLLLRDGALWVQVHACAGAMSRQLVIRRNGEPLASQTLTFAPDQPRTLWVNLPGPAGAAIYDAQLAAGSSAPASRDASPDLWPENDAARLIAPGPGPPRLLTLQPGDHLPGDAWMLAADGWQAIELREVGAEDLGRTEWQTLDSFVRETGGGLILIGARHAFGPGGYAGEPLADALSPLWSGPRDAPPAQIVFILDASASMNESADDDAAGTRSSGAESKFHIAARSVNAALQMLAPDDRVTVITFNGSARVAAAGTRQTLASTLDGSLAAVDPAGGTLPDAALPLAANALAAAPGPRKLALLLTDGQVPSLDAAAWQNMLTSTNAQLAILAPAAARTGPLAQLAAHAQWLDGTDPAAWPALFRQAVARIATGRARNDPLPWSSTAAAAPLTGQARAWIETWPKPQTTLMATGHIDQHAWPVAATAQRGLGRVAALTIAPDNPSAEALLQRVVQDVLPAAGDRRFTITAARDATGVWTIAADGRTADRFLDGESLLVREPDPRTAQLRDIPMTQTGPGHYVANVAAPAGCLIVRGPSAGEKGTQLIGRLDAPSVASDEWPASTDPSPIPPGVTILSPSDQGPPWQPRLARSPLDLSPCLWTIAALSALAALWARRSARR